MTFLDELAAAKPTPGGGSASAYVGAMAASLLMMYAGLALARKSYAAVYDEMRRAHDQATQLKDDLNIAVQDDARAFAAVIEANKLPKNSDARASAVQAAMKKATAIPMRVAEQSALLLQCAHDIMGNGLESADSDVSVAIFLAKAAIQGSLLNVRVNLETITDEQFVAEYRERIVRVQAFL